MSGAERPNANMRAAILEVLDIADRAGVAVGISSYQSAQDRNQPSLIQVQGGPAFGQMPAVDAVAIASYGDDSKYRGPGLHSKDAAIDFRLPATGVRVTVICEPSDPSR